MVKASAEDTRGAYSLLEITAPAGSPWSTHHVHDPDEAWYVVEGGLERFFAAFARLVEAARPGEVSREALDALAEQHGIVSVERTAPA
ncbi:MAG TPA: hypothetical protein VEQ11_13620 [Chloroflexota bacterium]|nr:hypothetical protein [Chloroflexota bacterium]